MDSDSDEMPPPLEDMTETYQAMQKRKGGPTAQAIRQVKAAGFKVPRLLGKKLTIKQPGKGARQVLLQEQKTAQGKRGRRGRRQTHKGQRRQRVATAGVAPAPDLSDALLAQASRLRDACTHPVPPASPTCGAGLCKWPCLTTASTSASAFATRAAASCDRGGVKTPVPNNSIKH